MNKFTIILSPKAVRTLDPLNNNVRMKIIHAMRVLEENPFPKGKLVRKIKGKASDYYRLREGKFRIFYMMEGNKIVILGILDKKEAQRFIRHLN